MRKINRDLLLLLATVQLFAAASKISASEFTIRPIALSGQPAPGVTARQFSGNFSDVQINGAGEVLFIDSLGLWSGPPEDLTPTILLNVPVPGQSFIFTYLGSPFLGDNGAAGFYALVRESTTNSPRFNLGLNKTVWTAAREKLTALSSPFEHYEEVEFEYELVPGLKRVMLQLPIHPNEQACFDVKGIALGAAATPYYQPIALRLFAWLNKYCIFADPGTNQAPANFATAVTDQMGMVALDRGKGIAPVVFPGFAAPGTTDRFNLIQPDSFAAFANDFAFRASTTGGQSGIWLGRSTNIQLAALSGAPVPESLLAQFGAGTSWSFGGQERLPFNHKAELAFSAVLYKDRKPLGSFLLAGPVETPRVALKFVSDDSVEPGFIDGYSVVMNAAGDLAFIGRHTSLREVPGFGGTPGSGINALGFTYQHGIPAVALAEGKSAPGLRDGEIISVFGYGGGPFMNARGEVLMHAEIGTAVGSQYKSDKGIWLVDPARGARLVVRGGTVVDLGSGRSATIDAKSVRFGSTHDRFRSGGEDGQAKPFNDLGQFIFVASYTETTGKTGAGVFVASQSSLRIDGADLTPTGFRIHFTGLPARTYTLERAAGLGQGWTKVGAELTGTGLPQQFIAVSSAQTGFFRIHEQ